MTDTSNKYLLKWVNMVLRPRGLSVTDVKQDFRDGFTLGAFLEELTGQKVPGKMNKIKNELMYLNNVTIALKLTDNIAKQCNVNARNFIGGTDLDEKYIYAYLFDLVLHESVIGISSELRQLEEEEGREHEAQKAERDQLLEWCNLIISPFNIKVDNFTKSWVNGLAYSAILQSYDNTIFNIDELKQNAERINNEGRDEELNYFKEEMKVNLQQFEKIFNVEELLDEEFVEFPSDKANIMYLSQVYKQYTKLKQLEREQQIKDSEFGLKRAIERQMMVEGLLREAQLINKNLADIQDAFNELATGLKDQAVSMADIENLEKEHNEYVSVGEQLIRIKNKIASLGSAFGIKIDKESLPTPEQVQENQEQEEKKISEAQQIFDCNTVRQRRAQQLRDQISSILTAATELQNKKVEMENDITGNIDNEQSLDDYEKVMSNYEAFISKSELQIVSLREQYEIAAKELGLLDSGYSTEDLPYLQKSAELEAELMSRMSQLTIQEEEQKHFEECCSKFEEEAEMLKQLVLDNKNKSPNDIFKNESAIQEASTLILTTVIEELKTIDSENPKIPELEEEQETIEEELESVKSELEDITAKMFAIDEQTEKLNERIEEADELLEEADSEYKEIEQRFVSADQEALEGICEELPKLLERISHIENLNADIELLKTGIVQQQAQVSLDQLELDRSKEDEQLGNLTCNCLDLQKRCIERQKRLLEYEQEIQELEELEQQLGHLQKTELREVFDASNLPKEEQMLESLLLEKEQLYNELNHKLAHFSLLHTEKAKLISQLQLESAYLPKCEKSPVNCDSFTLDLSALYEDYVEQVNKEISGLIQQENESKREDDEREEEEQIISDLKHFIDGFELQDGTGELEREAEQIQEQEVKLAALKEGPKKEEVTQQLIELANKVYEQIKLNIEKEENEKAQTDLKQEIEELFGKYGQLSKQDQHQAVERIRQLSALLESPADYQGRISELTDALSRDQLVDIASVEAEDLPTQLREQFNITQDSYTQEELAQLLKENNLEYMRQDFPAAAVASSDIVSRIGGKRESKGEVQEILKNLQNEEQKQLQLSDLEQLSLSEQELGWLKSKVLGEDGQLDLARFLDMFE